MFEFSMGYTKMTLLINFTQNEKNDETTEQQIALAVLRWPLEFQSERKLNVRRHTRNV